MKLSQGARYRICLAYFRKEINFNREKDVGPQINDEQVAHTMKAVDKLVHLGKTAGATLNPRLIEFFGIAVGYLIWLLC